MNLVKMQIPRIRLQRSNPASVFDLFGDNRSLLFSERRLRLALFLFLLKTTLEENHEKIAGFILVLTTLFVCMGMLTACFDTNSHSECEHEIVVDRGYAATCTKSGLSDGYHCSNCQAVLTKQTTIAALGHNIVALQAVPATCSSSGLTEGKTCSRCNAVIKEQKVVPKTSHKIENGKCSVCDTITDAKAVLTTYIVENGRYLSSSNCYYIYLTDSREDLDSQYLGAILYDCNDKELCAYLQYKSSLGEYNTTMNLDIGNNVKISVMSATIVGTYTASGCLFANTYESNNPYFFKFECSNNDMYSSLKDLLAANTSLMLQYCKLILA